MTLLTLVRLRTAKGTNSDSHGEYGKCILIGVPQTVVYDLKGNTPTQCHE